MEVSSKFKSLMEGKYEYCKPPALMMGPEFSTAVTTVSVGQRLWGLQHPCRIEYYSEKEKKSGYWRKEMGGRQMCAAVPSILRSTVCKLRDPAAPIPWN